MAPCASDLTKSQSEGRGHEQQTPSWFSKMFLMRVEDGRERARNARPPRARGRSEFPFADELLQTRTVSPAHITDVCPHGSGTLPYLSPRHIYLKARGSLAAPAPAEKRLCRKAEEGPKESGRDEGWRSVSVL